MRKTVLFLGTWMLIIGSLRLIEPTTFTQLMALDPALAWLAIGVGALTYVNGLYWFGLLDLRFAFKALGGALLVTTAYAINSPTLGDMRQTYVPVADLFIALESAIVLLLLAAEKTDGALSPLVYLSLIGTYLHRRVSARWAVGQSFSRRSPYK